MPKGSDKSIPENPLCGDPAALVSYLYNDGTPEELALIDAHVQTCDACTRELASLGDTREQLAAWIPPPAELGFAITSARSADIPSDPARPELASSALTSQLILPTSAATLPWWRQPTPMWMQAVAASAVFAAGLVIGGSSNSGGSATASTPSASTTASAVNASGPANRPTDVAANDGAAKSVSRSELADLERRLRDELARLTSAGAAPVQTAARTDDASRDQALLKRVQSLLTDSEERQRRELALRTAQVLRDVEIQRKVDMATVQQNIGQLQGATGVEMKQQRELFNQLMNNVNLRGPVR